MKNKPLQFIYFWHALLLITLGVITKFLLIDEDIAAQFKSSNSHLLSSDIIFIMASGLIIFGILLALIKRNRKSSLKIKTIVSSALLIIPITLFVAITPLIDTLHPGSMGNGVVSNIYSYSLIFAAFAGLSWVVFIIKILITQIYIIASNRIE